MSFVDETGEWETRKISIFGALQSFISQLSIGDDLTKISLPSVLLFPYSALELAASRGLAFVDILLRANREKEALDRLLGLAQWYLTYTQKEKLGKKPYNPILAETHLSWVEDKDDNGATIFFAEQVCHHPPVTAFVMENAKENFKMHANVTFGTAFHGNSVTAVPTGPTILQLDNHNETYVFKESMPNISIKNVIIGTRRHVWEGTVTITCQESGLQATLNYYEEGWYCINTVSGFVTSIDKPENKLITFTGPLSDVVTCTNLSTNKTEQLIDLSKLAKQKLQYLPLEKQSDRASLRVWKDLSHAIVENDMYKADVAKHHVEDAQRKRRNEGASYRPAYFVLNQETQLWDFDRSKLADLTKEVENATKPVESKQTESQETIVADNGMGKTS